MLQRFVEVMIGIQLDNLSNLISGNTYDMNSAFFLHKMWSLYGQDGDIATCSSFFEF